VSHLVSKGDISDTCTICSQLDAVLMPTVQNLPGLRRIGQSSVESGVYTHSVASAAFLTAAQHSILSQVLLLGDAVREHVVCDRQRQSCS
jgi:hypothetical protein